MKLGNFSKLFIALILIMTMVIAVNAKDLTKATGISFKETPDKDIVIIHLDSPATYHEIKSSTNTIIDVLNSKFTGKETVKLILKKSVKLVRAINIKGKDNIARFMIILNNKFPVTSYKKNNQIYIEI
jgi:MFS superfamily sulfate permease-like transporter